MSIRFYIIPVDPKAWEDPDDSSEKPTSNLHIDPAQFTASITNHFSMVSNIGSERYMLESEHDTGIEVHLGSVKTEGYSYVSFTGGCTNFIEFILWFRRFVSLNHTLHLFNSSSWDRLILTENTTFEDVKNFTGWTDC